jgi:subfamily B ATP-binding cassette protein MsbA
VTGSAALDGVDFSAPGGRTTALVGRSGSGKSTLLSLVPRLYDPTGGEVLNRWPEDPRRDACVAARRHRGREPGRGAVRRYGAGQYRLRPARAQRRGIVAAAQAAAAHDFIQRLPQGYDTPVGPGGSRLSGGERQRITLARAFLKDAPILLLDEATSALDSESEHLVQGAIARLMVGRTTLVIAHRLSTVRKADLIVVMEGGRIVESGTHDSLLRRGGAYARSHRLQLADDGAAAPATPAA